MKKMKWNVALVSRIAAVVSAGIAIVQFARDTEGSSTPPVVIVYMVQNYAFHEEMEQ